MALQKKFLAFSETFDSVIYLSFDCFVVLLTEIFLFAFSWQFLSGLDYFFCSRLVFFPTLFQVLLVLVHSDFLN